MFSFASRKGTLGEVPWVMGDPTSTYKWQVAAAGKGKKSKDREHAKSEMLENIVVNIILDVKKRDIEGGFITGVLGRQIEEDINNIEVAEVLLRGLHKAKYTEINAITGDGKTLHYAKVDDKSFKEIMEDLGDRNGSKYTLMKIKASHGATRTANVEIRKRHSRKKAPITIAFEGKISTGTLNTLVGYLNKHLPVKAVQME